ncbi:PREDICTED: elastin-like [Rhagoletis zephyria]|uniref:elastin-like n=1 Tax=Rhagoletis zephyria TaxID=28612 RepID=UPI0008118053|nr:PREDICTED: elastin-like [Rhagoletis zephyria]
MKFVIAVVMLAFAVVAVHSSLLGAQISPGVSYVAPPLLGGLGPLSIPGLLGGIPGISLSQGPLGGVPGILGGVPGILGGIPGISLSQGPLGGVPGILGGIPGISLSQGPLGAAIASPIALGGGPGVYVAKTRGAIHTAPLEGHINSATSVNLAPAPGTL